MKHIDLVGVERSPTQKKKKRIEDEEEEEEEPRE